MLGSRRPAETYDLMDGEAKATAEIHILAQNIFIDLQIVASILFVTHSTTMGCVASDQAAEPVATVALELPVAGSVEHSTGSAPRKAKAAKKKCAGKAGISSDDWVGLALVHRTL
eukprot:symbB.v1.2.025967.t1/scaffold2549.1/size76517/4